jgi:hypothetical protein
VMATSRNATTQAEAAMRRFIGSLPCAAAGSAGKCRERGEGLLCERHGREWEGRSGFCSGWTDEERRALEDVWVRSVELRAIPEDRRQARRFAHRGLGRIVPFDDGWAWEPSISFVPASVARRAV